MFKLAKFVRATKGLDITLLGWERRLGEGKETYLDFDVPKEYVLKGGGYGGASVRARYVLWMFRIFFRSLKYRRGDLVWALGFESAFPALLAGRVRGFDVIFDDADRFSLLFPLPKVIKGIVASLERWTSRRVAVHVIPGVERYDFESSRFYLLRNMPSEVEIETARMLYQQRTWPKAALMININGWLGSGRGMSVALALSKRLQGADVGFLMAGKLDCDEAKELAKRPQVHYLGEVSNAEALSTYYASDYVFTYYKPDSVINRFAESNKWGDAFKTGVGIIVNKEVATAAYVVNGGAAISVEYDDLDGLVAAIEMALHDKSLVLGHKAASSELGTKYGYYESQLKQLFRKLEVGHGVG
ncbi:hypothetical protein ASD82_13975 [Rhodanobacter sp. Root179]|nr:hypothetical protein ASD82_13975 [Rhodanobacter sp. Root179]